MSDLELHAAQFVHDVTHRLADGGPGDLALTLRCRLHGVPRQVKERDDVTHHTHRLVERTLPATRQTAN